MTGDRTGFDHMTIVVEDLEEAKNFFGILGFVENKSVTVSGEIMSSYMGIPKWEAEHVTLVHRDCKVHQEVQLLVFHHPEATIDRNSGNLARTGFNHVCFRVDDLDATLEMMNEAGFKARNEVMDFHDRRLVFLNGPSGVVVELADWQIEPASP